MFRSSMLRLKKYAREFRTPERKQKIRKGSEAIREAADKVGVVNKILDENPDQF